MKNRSRPRRHGVRVAGAPLADRNDRLIVSRDAV